jgi:hypothetical protein
MASASLRDRAAGTATPGAKRPGRSSAASRTSGRFVAPITITLVSESKPFHLGQDLVQRLLALVVARR